MHRHYYFERRKTRTPHRKLDVEPLGEETFNHLKVVDTTGRTTLIGRSLKRHRIS